MIRKFKDLSPAILQEIKDAIKKNKNVRPSEVEIRVTDYDGVSWYKHPLLWGFELSKKIFGKGTDSIPYFIHVVYFDRNKDVHPKQTENTRYPYMMRGGEDDMGVLERLCEYVGREVNELVRQGIKVRVVNSFRFYSGAKNHLSELLSQHFGGLLSEDKVGCYELRGRSSMFPLKN